MAALPFELGAMSHKWLRRLRLPVVSYALPALIAIGQVRHHFRPTRFPLTRLLRDRLRRRTLERLERIQPPSGGFLEAAPLTSFVAMSLASIGQGGHAVELLRGLQESVRARVSLRTRIRAEQESPKWEIRLTTGFIFLTVVFARITNPAYGAFWRTPVGSISLFVAFALAVAGFFFANQVLASSARVEESFGTALPGQPEAIAPPDMPIQGRAS